MWDIIVEGEQGLNTFGANLSPPLGRLLPLRLLSLSSVDVRVAMPEIQAIRQNKQIPGARRLHEYANLYFDAHNAMLSRVRGHNSTICVLQIDAAILDFPGVIVTDRNAASGWVSFLPVNEGLEAIDRDRLFARSWKHPEDMYDEMSHKSEKCAEVLVPDRAEARFVMECLCCESDRLGGVSGIGNWIARAHPR